MFNLSKELKQNYGTHRSGWSYAVNCLKPLNNVDSPELISFVEKKFIFGKEPGDRLCDFQNITRPWVGFMHVPVYVPQWFFGHYSPVHLLKDSEFNAALSHCKGLFTLSSPLSRWLASKLDVPISAVLHPTENVTQKFNPEAYFANEKKTVIQLGWWLRKLHAIHQLDLPNDKFVKKTIWLSKPYQQQTILMEKSVFNFGEFSEDIEYLGFMDDDLYDKELSKSVVFVDFYDTAANNAVIECIVRAVPILCRPLQAVVDYLGVEYPFYYQDYDEARRKLMSKDLVIQAHEYLLQSGIANKLTPEYFIRSIRNSKVMCEN